MFRLGIFQSRLELLLVNLSMLNTCYLQNTLWQVTNMVLVFKEFIFSQEAMEEETKQRTQSS